LLAWRFRARDRAGPRVQGRETAERATRRNSCSHGTQAGSTNRKDAVMDKQLFAKLGVCALLGLNVGAYYVFWPSQNGNKTEAQTPKEEKGQTQLLPTPAEPARPKELSPKPLVDAVPIGVPIPPKLPESKPPTEREIVGKLSSLIKEQGGADKPPVTLINPPTPNAFDEKKILVPEKPLSPPPGFPEEGKPKPLPAFPSEPLKPAVFGVTSPLTPKLAPEKRSPWTFKVEKADKGQKLVTAKLTNPVFEFRIFCDSVTQNLGGVELDATGVRLETAGISVRCKRLTVPVGLPPRFVFEGDVVVNPGTPFDGSMRTDRLVWELHPMPIIAPPGALGAPK
jgi:hypothetical protein